MKRLILFLFFTFLIIPNAVNARYDDEFINKNGLGKITCEYALKSENAIACGGKNLFLQYDDSTKSVTLICEPRWNSLSSSFPNVNYFVVKKDQSLLDTQSNVRDFTEGKQLTCPSEMYIYNKNECLHPDYDNGTCSTNNSVYYFSKTSLDSSNAGIWQQVKLPFVNSVVEYKPDNNSGGNNDGNSEENNGGNSEEENNNLLNCVVPYLGSTLDSPDYGLISLNFIFNYTIDTDQKNIIKVEETDKKPDYVFNNKLTFDDIVENAGDSSYRCRSEIKDLTVEVSNYDKETDILYWDIKIKELELTPGDKVYGCEVIPDDIREWIKDTLNLVKYIALVLVIVLGILDFIKAAASGEADQMKKSGSSFLKRIIAVIILFLLPVIVELVLNLIEIYGADSTCLPE